MSRFSADRYTAPCRNRNPVLLPRPHDPQHGNIADGWGRERGIDFGGLKAAFTVMCYPTRPRPSLEFPLKRKINPTRVPIEQKESMRWLDNLRLSTECNHPA
ncbi:hypothetical protein [Roseibium sp.]|uniref:hypothetical protein n=1 Tax=Roseibium sp. TaxID=1936156 RepID=UPI003A973A85